MGPLLFMQQLFMTNALCLDVGYLHTRFKARPVSFLYVSQAVKLVAEAPNGLLRTRETIQRFQAIPQLPGQQPALSVYFKTLLEKGKLKSFEAVELARIVLQKAGGAAYIQKLIGEDKVWQPLPKAGQKEKVVVATTILVVPWSVQRLWWVFLYGGLFVLLHRLVVVIVHELAGIAATPPPQTSGVSIEPAACYNSTARSFIGTHLASQEAA